MNLRYEAEREVNEKNEKFNLNLSGEQLRDEINKAFQEKIKELAMTLVDSLNTMGVENSFVEGFMQGLHSSHRELQSNFWKMVLKLMKDNATLDTSRYFDGRNEWTKNMCKCAYIAGYSPEAITDMDKYETLLTFK